MDRGRRESLPIGQQHRDAIGGSDGRRASRHRRRGENAAVRFLPVLDRRGVHDTDPVDLPEHHGGAARDAARPEEPRPSRADEAAGFLGATEVEAVGVAVAASGEAVGPAADSEQIDVPHHHEAVLAAQLPGGRHDTAPIPDTSLTPREASPILPARGQTREVETMIDGRLTMDAAAREHARALDAFLDRHAADLERLAETCAACLASGGKLLFFGNGGSASDSQHLAAEFVNRFDRDRPALGAVALATDGSVLTSIGNDSSFQAIFERQVEALGRPGDVAIAISTSGRSPNIVAGLRAARRLGLRTAALLGRDGGPARSEADLSLVVPSSETARVQEVHIFAGHVLCRLVEDRLASAREGGTVTSSGS